MSKIPEQRLHGPVVAVVVDESDASLAEVKQAAQEAARNGVPLELLEPSPQVPMSHPQRARQMQRMDTALDIARKAAPGLEVRLPLASEEASHPDDQLDGSTRD